MTPLVFVHGFMGGSEQWRLQDPLLQKRNGIAVDLPGFGKNAEMASIASIEGFAEWVLSDLTRQNITKFDLLGHSMGGMIVQEMVRQAPGRVGKLVLYGTGTVGELPGRFEPIETSMQRARDDGPEATARRIAATWFRDFEASQGYADCAKIAERASLSAILDGLRAMKDWDGRGALADIACETLVLWGELDRSYAWEQIERLWSTIPSSALAVVPQASHAVHAERHVLFNLLVDEFLDAG